MWQKGEPGWRSGRGQGEDAVLQARRQVLGVNGDCAHEGLWQGPGLGRGPPTGSWGPAQGGPRGSPRFRPQEPWAHRGLPHSTGALHKDQRPPYLRLHPPGPAAPERSHRRRHLVGCRREPRAAWDIPTSASLKLHWNQSRGGGATPPPAAGPNTFLKGQRIKCALRGNWPYHILKRV